LTARNDGVSDMTVLLLDDDTTEALLAGEPVDERFAALASTLAAMRDDASIDAPEPSGELAALLASPDALAVAVGSVRLQSADAAEGAPAAENSHTTFRRQGSARSRVTRIARAAGGLGLAAKLALGSGAAAAAVGGASVAGVLPPPIHELVHEVTHRDDSPSVPTTPTGPDGSSTRRGSPGTETQGEPPVPTASSSAVSSSPSTPSTGIDGEAPPSTSIDIGRSPNGNGNGNGAANGNAGGNGNGVANGPADNNAGGNGNAPGNSGGNGNGVANGPADDNAGGNGATSGNATGSGATNGKANGDATPG